MALDLTDTTPFPSFSLGALDTDRPGFTFAPETSDLSFDFGNLDLSPDVMKKAFAANMFMSTMNNNNNASGGNALPYGINMNPSGNLDKFGNSMIASSLLADTKEKAQKNLFMGAALKTAASAGNLFNSLLSMGLNYNLIDKQKKNTKMSVENRMQALDNQVLYYKNQITDKFNTLMARNTVTMAAKNLRVSTGALLEESKDAAYDATKDIQMLESNAELKKIALRNEEKQAKISAKLAKSQLVTNVIQGFANLGLNVASGGGTMESWGDLYSGFKAAEDFEAIKKASATGMLADLY